MVLIKDKLKKKIFKAPKKHATSFWGTFVVLLLFWILITWRLHYQHLVVGAFVSYALVRFNNDILFTPDDRPFLNRKTIVLGARYFLDLVIAIFKANIDVALIVLRPKMPISPGIVKFKSRANKSVTKVALANSITLTPGTLTLDVIDDVYVVHCLTRANAVDVADWDMEKKMLAIGEAGS